jgi:hypothetical protein
LVVPSHKLIPLANPKTLLQVEACLVPQIILLALNIMRLQVCSVGPLLPLGNNLDKHQEDCSERQHNLNNNLRQEVFSELPSNKIFSEVVVHSELKLRNQLPHFLEEPLVERLVLKVR